MTAATDADRLREVYARLTDAVADLTESDAWRQLLTVASKLPTYSPHNLLLIASQRPDATHVAGYGAWRQLGRQVRTGETGIGILAPVRARVPAAAGPDPDLYTGQGQATQTLPPEQPAARAVRRFRVVYVFDVAQTDGPLLPEIVPVLLDGATPPGLWDELARQVARSGFFLTRGDCAPANGVTDHTARTVTVAAGLTDAQALKTLAHELAHVRLHGPGSPDGMTRHRVEVEAESVAYLITVSHGMDPTRYTVPYVAGWSGGDLSLLRATAERVLTTAGQILATALPVARPVTPAVRPATRTARRERGLNSAPPARPRRTRTLEVDR
jgi:N-terminal domain of anti-restriction factor ArdC